jgi:glutathione S-transferase
MAKPILYIGDKRLSSWSMRPWIVLKRCGIAFEERMIRLDQAKTRAEIEAISPGGTVPVLHAGELVIWDSLAICEWAAEQCPGGVWPESADRRARARAAACWMHSGIPDLRNECPMDLHRKLAPIELSAAARKDLADVEALWSALKCGDGPFLFGAWSIADAMFAPVATRIRDYQLPVGRTASDYCEALTLEQSFLDWQFAAENEPAAD